MSFQISGLARSQFEHLFPMSDPDLRRHGAVRIVADKPAAFPCRVSLVDADVGDAVILANFQHQPAASPFRSTHAVFVRVTATDRRLAPDDVPALLRTRILSVRGFDAAGMMTAADLVQGTDIEPLIDRMLADAATDYLHIHYAKPGCFAVRVERA